MSLNATDSSSSVTDLPVPRRPPFRDSGQGATIAAVVTTIVTVLPVFLVGGQSVQIGQSIGMTEAVLGLVAASYWTTSALLSARAGIVAARIGSRAGMLLAIGFAAVAAVGSLLLTPTWGWLIVWMVLAGAANAIGHPPSNAHITLRATRNRALAFGIKQAAIPLSTLAAGASVPLFALTVGWRASFLVLLGFAVVAAVLVLIFVRRMPRPSARPIPSATPTKRTPRAALPRDLRRFLTLASWASFFGAAQANAIGTFTVASASSIGIEPTTAAGILVLGSAAGVVARPLVGVAADRGIGGTMATVSIMMGAGAIGLVGMAVGIPVTFALGCILGFGFGWGWNGLVHYAVSRRSGPFTARATGIVQRGAYAGSAAGPLAFGLLLSQLGSTWSWSIAVVVALAGVAFALLAYRAERALGTSPSNT